MLKPGLSAVLVLIVGVIYLTLTIALFFTENIAAIPICVASYFVWPVLFYLLNHARAATQRRLFWTGIALTILGVGLHLFFTFNTIYSGLQGFYTHP